MLVCRRADNESHDIGLSGTALLIASYQCLLGHFMFCSGACVGNWLVASNSFKERLAIPIVMVIVNVRRTLLHHVLRQVISCMHDTCASRQAVDLLLVILRE